MYLKTSDRHVCPNARSNVNHTVSLFLCVLVVFLSMRGSAAGSQPRYLPPGDLKAHTH